MLMTLVTRQLATSVTEVAMTPSAWVQPGRLTRRSKPSTVERPRQASGREGMTQLGGAGVGVGQSAGSVTVTTLGPMLNEFWRHPKISSPVVRDVMELTARQSAAAPALYGPRAKEHIGRSRSNARPLLAWRSMQGWGSVPGQEAASVRRRHSAIGWPRGLRMTSRLTTRHVATGPTPKGPRSRRQPAVTVVRVRRSLAWGSWAHLPGRETAHDGVDVGVVVITQPANDDEGRTMVVVGVIGVDLGTKGVKDVEELVSCEEVSATEEDSDRSDELEELVVSLLETLDPCVLEVMVSWLVDGEVVEDGIGTEELEETVSVMAEDEDTVEELGGEEVEELVG